MSGPEAKNPASAGITSPEEIDVAALFERLREELRRGAVDGDTRGAEVASIRALAERFWPVSAERDAGGGPKGVVKRVLRKLMRWYVEPMAADQRVFNDSVLKLVDTPAWRPEASTRMRTWSRMPVARASTSSRRISSSTSAAWTTTRSAGSSWARSSSTFLPACWSAC